MHNAAFIIKLLCKALLYKFKFYKFKLDSAYLKYKISN